MKRFIASLFLGVIFVVFTGPGAYAADWTGEVRYTVVPGRNAPALRCPGIIVPGTVHGLSAAQQLCVVEGEAFRFATYFENGTRLRAAIAYRYDSVFTRLHGVCEQFWGCVYAPKTDRLVDLSSNGGSQRVAVIYERVSARIIRGFDPGPTYRFDVSLPDFTLVDIHDDKVNIGSIALSENGHWLVAELRDHGFTVTNLENRQTTWLTPSGPRYGFGFDPIAELAVSNDGRAVAVMGENAGLAVRRVEHCGRTLDTSLFPLSAPEFPTCSAVPIDQGQLSATFRRAVTPRFNRAGDRLTMTVIGSGHPPRAAALSVGNSPDFGYVALGDSFTSGEGETNALYYQMGADDQVHQCHISSRAYPALIARSFLMSTEQFLNAACSGSRMDEVPFDRHFGRVLSVGIGGNDVGLMTKLRACAAPDSCEWATDQRLKNALSGEFERLTNRLADFYRKLSVWNPGSVIYAVGYPMPIVPAGECGPIINTLLNPEERAFLYHSVELLNQSVQRAAEGVGVEFVDIADSLTGYELCSGSGQPAMNGFRLGDDVSPIELFPALKIIGSESFHPTPYGHQLMASRILERRPDFLTRTACSPSCGSGAGGVPSHSQPELILQSDALTHEDEFGSGSAVTLNLPAGSLLPDSSVTISLHSAPLSLGDAVVSADGSLRAEIQLPSFSAGYHTIHVEGRSYAGRAIDVYQGISIAVSEAETPEGADAIPADEQARQSMLRAVSSEKLRLSSLVREQPPFINEHVQHSPKERVLGARTQVPAPESQAITWWSLLLGGLLIVGLIVILWRIWTHDPGG